MAVLLRLMILAHVELQAKSVPKIMLIKFVFICHSVNLSVVVT